MVRLFGYDVFTKGTPPPAEDFGDVFSEKRNPAIDGVHKAYSPEFLYNPPYGYPRALNIQLVRQLSANPYIYAIVKSICDEVASASWDLVFKEDCENPEKYEEVRKNIKAFIQNPNRNKESFQDILRQSTKDILELDSGIWVKVFNRKMEMVQLFAKDGGSFLKNPDVYGYMGARAEYVEPLALAEPPKDSPDYQQYQQLYELTYKNQAAYFQYGQSPTAYPVPFGRREVVYHSLNPRANSIYGTSPIQILADVITNLVYSAAYNLDFYMNGNMPEGFVSIIGADKEQLKAMRERLQAENRVKDPATGFWRKVGFKVPFTNQEVKFTPIQLDPKTMQIVEQQQWFTRVVWSAFGVTPDEMGFTDTSNRSVSESQKKTYIRKAVRPILLAYKYRIDNELIPEWGKEAFQNLEFRWDEYDLDEELKKAQLAQQYIGMGVKTPKMVAEELGIDYSEVEEEQAMAMTNEGMPPAPGEEGDFSFQPEDEGSSTQQKALRGEVVAGHKYFRREGAAGNYRYFYSEEPKRRAADEPVEWDVHGVVTKEMKEAYSNLLGKAREYMEVENSQLQAQGKPKKWSDEYDYLFNEMRGHYRAAFDSFGSVPEYQKAALLYNSSPEYFWRTLERIPGPYDPHVRTMAYHLSSLRYAPAWFQTRLAERGLLRYNDPKKVTSLLKGIGVKIKVSKKYGIESADDAKNRTVAAKQSAAVKTEHKGVEFTIGPGYKKKAGVGQEVLHPLFQKALDSIPDSHIAILKQEGIKVAFVGRGEVKDLANSNNIGRAGGYYDGMKKLIVVFPPTEVDEAWQKRLDTGLSENPIKLRVQKQALVAAGYSEEVASSIAKGDYGTAGSYKTLLHEIGHAVALASSTKAAMQNKWNEETMERRDQEVMARNRGIMGRGPSDRLQAIEEFENNYASSYASTSTKEDFAETYAFYATRKPYIDAALDKGQGWLSEGQRERFALMRKLWES